MQSYVDLLKEKISQLSSYRDMGTWLSCNGSFESISQLNDSSIQWSEIKSPFQCKGNQDFWFRKSYTIPESVSGFPMEGTAFRLLCFVLAPTEIYVNGTKVFQEKFWADARTPEVFITQKAVPGETYDIVIHITNNSNMETLGLSLNAYMETDRIEDMAFDMDAFIYEMQYCAQFKEIEAVYQQALEYVQNSLSTESSISDILSVIQKAREILAPAAEYTKKYTVHLVGHAHIDMNWLWTMEDTIDVCKRDFATMTKIMDEDPDFHFSQSQVSVYDITEKHFPETFAKIQKYVEKGNWDVTAATWTEGDLNMANGEAIARHILYSRKYLKERFGVTSRICWEPDTFGHPANLPQILKKSGVDYYYHMRCGDGYPLYWWQGVDGSRLLAFNSPYGGVIRSDKITEISSQLRNNHGLKDAMFVYGVGDHGGGPTRRDIVKAKMLNALPTMPRIIFSTTHAFFDKVKEQEPTNLPITKGEMNPIFDGCYTSHADIKKGNRYSENKLFAAETAQLLAMLYNGQYDEDTLAECWQTVLFNQFHDIFDGCAIHPTYERTKEQHAAIQTTADDVVQKSLSLVSANITAGGQGKAFAVWNLQGFTRSDIVALDMKEDAEEYCIRDVSGNLVPSQIMDGKIYFMAKDVPSMGYRVYTLDSMTVPDAEPTIQEKGKCFSLESDFFALDVEKDSGCIINLFDKKAGKKVIDQKDWIENKTTYSNLFRVEDEIPHGMSAWVIGPISKVENLLRGASVTIKADGPVMQVLEITHMVRHSTIIQQMMVYKELGRIDFKTKVDWQEESNNEVDAPMLKVSFMPELKGQPKAAYDIPFGNIERIPDGTEYPSQKWVDISDDKYGFSLLNDSKYGFSANGSTLSMTCIRTSYAPDPVPDKGDHEFSYSLVPHQGSWQQAKTPEMALAFNNPLIPVTVESCGEAALPQTYSWAQLDGDGVILSSLKKAAEDNSIIVRVYNIRETAAPFTLKLAFSPETIHEVSISEDRTYRQVPCDSNGFADVLQGYEIKTYKVCL